MNTTDITKLTQELNTWRARAKDAADNYERSKASEAQFPGHQYTISVAVGDQRLNVTDMSRETGYGSKVIRGREMILLGVQKVLFCEADNAARKVTSLEHQLRLAVLQEQA